MFGSVNYLASMRQKPTSSLRDLRKFMSANGLRPADLARGAKITKAAAGDLLAGRSNPRPQTRVDIETWTSGAVSASGWDDALRPSPGIQPFGAEAA